MAKRSRKSDSESAPPPAASKKPEPGINPGFSLPAAQENLPGLTKPVEGHPSKPKTGLKEDVEEKARPKKTPTKKTTVKTSAKKTPSKKAVPPSPKKAAPKEISPKKIAPKKSLGKSAPQKPPVPHAIAPKASEKALFNRLSASIQKAANVALDPTAPTSRTIPTPVPIPPGRAQARLTTAPPVPTPIEPAGKKASKKTTEKVAPKKISKKATVQKTGPQETAPKIVARKVAPKSRAVPKKVPAPPKSATGLKRARSAPSASPVIASAQHDAPIPGRLQSSITRAGDLTCSPAQWPASAAAVQTTVSSHAAADSQLRNLPETYSQGFQPAGDRRADSRLVLLARDPDWLYAYWDISPEDRDVHNLGGHYGAPLVFLRLHALRHSGIPAATGSFDLMIQPDAGNWLIQIPRIERDWQAEMGYVGKDGRFVSIIASNLLSSPYTEPHLEVQPAERDRVAAFSETANQLRDRISGAGSLGACPLPEYTPAPYPLLQPQLPPWPVFPPQDAFFEDMVPQPIFAGHTNAAINAAGASELLLRLPQKESVTEISRPQPSGASEMTLSQAGPELMPASLPFGAPAPAQAAAAGDFWLWVRTEIIIYGATQPDAQVTLQGQPLVLRPDGTFSVRFALPQGEYFYPVRAVNDRRDRQLQIIAVVTRRTES